MHTWDIPTNEVEDILQEVFLRVMEKVQGFEHQGTGTFRAWLKRISRNCWLQSVRQAAYRARLNNVSFDLASCLAESTMRLIDTQIDDLIEREAFDFAVQRTRRESSDKSWEVYRLMTFEGLSAFQAAKVLGISTDLAYKTRERFDDHLQAHLKAMDAGD